MSRAARATKDDIRRAIEAAKEAGVDVVVEITREGTIRLIIEEGQGLTNGERRELNPWDHS